MIQRPIGGRVLSALLVCLIVLGGALAAAAQAESTEILQVVESFRRLATLDPSIAGEVWMDAAALAEWRDSIGSVAESPIGSSIWFVDAQAFVEASEDASPRGGLYSPWLGVLLLLELNENADTITGLSIESVDEPIAIALDPFDLALTLMDSIERGARRFEDLAAGAIEPAATDEGRSTFAARIEAYDDLVSPAFDPAAIGGSVAHIVDRLLAGVYDGPLSLLESEDPDWVTSLAPVWVGDSGVVVLGSSVEPLSLVWLEIGDGAEEVLSATLIELFDRVTTRGGDGS